MLGSLYSAISGLQAHQFEMNVIGNNIANVNTVGFKKSRVTFSEVLAHTLSGGASSQGGKAGTNPIQVGLGTTTGAVDVINTQGGVQSTGKQTDLCIEGDGFFVVTDGQNKMYTRAGNFDFDGNGNFYNTSNGMEVLGYTADSNGNINTSNLGPIKMNTKSVNAQATTKVTFNKNLDARMLTTDPAQAVSKEIYDSLGNQHSMSTQFTKTGSNTWKYDVYIDGSATSSGSGTITFDNTGKYVSTAVTTAITFAPTDAAAMNVAVDFSNVSQYSSDFSATADSQDGFPAGDLKSFSLDKTGTISGVYSNGQAKNIGQIAIATFTNPGGLLKNGENLYLPSNNSGNIAVGIPGTAGRGNVLPGDLEMSNVDLSQEFVNMIVAQRGFQANSKIITTSDEMLQDLINIKR